VVPDGTVYLLGGEQALSPAVQQAVVDAGFQPQRLAGTGRIETALAVADEILRRNPDQRTAVVARAAGTPDIVTAGWADSVTIGAWTAGRQIPVLITPTDQLAPAVDAWLDANGIDTTLVVGGTSAITDDVAAQVPGPRRIAGSDRAGTAAAVAAELISGDPAQVIVLNGYRDDGWAFGLPAAGLAADFGVPLLVAGGDVPGATAATASTPCGNPPAVDALLLGSPAVLGVAVVEQLDRADGGPCAPPPPPPPPLSLRTDGLSEVPLGTLYADGSAVLTDLFGEPFTDSGWIPMSDVNLCPHEEARALEWDGLSVLFGRGATGDIPPGLVRYIAYEGDVGSGLATVTGVGPGDSVGELIDAHPDVGFDDFGDCFLYFTSYAEPDVRPHNGFGLGGASTSDASDGIVESVDVLIAGRASRAWSGCPDRLRSSWSNPSSVSVRGAASTGTYPRITGSRNSSRLP